MDQKALVLIPSRFASTRFPGKPLAQISGKSMIRWVYDGCREISRLFPGSVVCVVTDNHEIENEVKAFGGEVVRVDDDVVSGSERIQLAYERFYAKDKFDLVINVQGDEPLIKASILEELIKYHATSNVDVATVVKKQSQNSEHFNDPNKVKAIFNETNGFCHYFTRSSVPYNRAGFKDVDWFLHVGIYSYKPHALKEFCKLPQSLNEKLECLEQLRLIDNGFRIGAILSDMKLAGVDSPADIKYVEEVLNESKY